MIQCGEWWVVGAEGGKSILEGGVAVFSVRIRMLAWVKRKRERVELFWLDLEPPWAES